MLYVAGRSPGSRNCALPRLPEDMSSVAFGESCRLQLRGQPWLWAKPSPHSLLAPCGTDDGADYRTEIVFRQTDFPALAAPICRNQDGRHLVRKATRSHIDLGRYRQVRKPQTAQKTPSVANTSRELAVRNQFFTPRYVVDFLVQNTLGRRLIESDPNSPLLADLLLLVDAPRPGTSAASAWGAVCKSHTPTCPQPISRPAMRRGYVPGPSGNSVQGQAVAHRAEPSEPPSWRTGDRTANGAVREAGTWS